MGYVQRKAKKLPNNLWLVNIFTFRKYLTNLVIKKENEVKILSKTFDLPTSCDSHMKIFIIDRYILLVIIKQTTQSNSSFPYKLPPNFETATWYNIFSDKLLTDNYYSTIKSPLATVEWSKKNLFSINSERRIKALLQNCNNVKARLHP